MQKKMGKKKQTKNKKRSVPDEWEVSVAEEDEGNKNSIYSLPEDVQITETADASSTNEDNSIAIEPSDESSVPAEATSKKRRKLKDGVLVQRSEPSLTISEFNLTEVGKEKVHLDELIRTSQKLSGQTFVKKQLQKAKKLKSLSTPLSKPKLEKIKRTIAYDKVCEDVTKWEPIVRTNRSADQIIYPLKQPELRTEPFEKVSEKFVTKHPLEIAINELLNKSEHNLKADKPLTAAEEKALQAMSLEEAKLRHIELMKHRALISYQVQKARRQNKIKSRRYRRILKKDKLKKTMKEFEELQKVDPAAAIEKILEADKLRITERMTLKHRNTGKWAKVQKMRAKYNPDARNDLKEDVNIGRQLREKVADVEETVSQLKASLATQYADEVDVGVYNPGLIEDTHSIDLLESNTVVPFTNLEPEPSLTSETLSNRPMLQDSTEIRPNGEKAKKLPTPAVASEFVNMDFISEAKVLNSYKPSNITIGDHLDEVEGEDDTDDEDSCVKNVSEAFADEDLIAEFTEEKKASEEANRPKGIDMYLPGWGSWGGAGIKDNKRKKQRFFIKPPEDPAKRNTQLNVILNEDKDTKASVHQVKQLPYPFINIHQFESYIRQPLGHTWNAQSSFENLVAPRTITKMGKIIQPIDAEDVVLEKRVQQKPEIQKGNQKEELKAF